ncbi:MAG: hypothetical protein RL369_2068 [Pseudomonadota bacterium]
MVGAEVLIGLVSLICTRIDPRGDWNLVGLEIGLTVGLLTAVRVGVLIGELFGVLNPMDALAANGLLNDCRFSDGIAGRLFEADLAG